MNVTADSNALFYLELVFPRKAIQWTAAGDARNNPMQDSHRQHKAGSFDAPVSALSSLLPPNITRSHFHYKNPIRHLSLFLPSTPRPKNRNQSFHTESLVLSHPHTALGESPRTRWVLPGTRKRAAIEAAFRGSHAHSPPSLPSVPAVVCTLASDAHVYAWSCSGCQFCCRQRGRGYESAGWAR